MTRRGCYAPLLELSAHTDVLLPATDIRFNDVFGYSNASGASLERLRASQGSGVAEAGSVTLGRLPEGSLVFPESARLLVGDCFVAEQLHYRRPNLPNDNLLLIPPVGTYEDVADEVLLVSRFGEGTWGHWLGELLPKVAVCEARFPGRFVYAVPARTGKDDLIGRRQAESLSYYGVEPSRLICLDDRKTYRFARLHAVTEVFQVGFHPGVIDILRQPIALTSSDGPQRVALFRGDNKRRMISNIEQTRALLIRRGFSLVDVALASFPQQVELLARASTIFSVLGSSLTGLLYAPSGVNVVAASPEGFRDRFFAAMVRQLPEGRFHSVIGPITLEDTRLPRDSAFDVPMIELERALDAADGRNVLR